MVRGGTWVRDAFRPANHALLCFHSGLRRDVRLSASRLRRDQERRNVGILALRLAKILPAAASSAYAATKKSKSTTLEPLLINPPGQQSWVLCKTHRLLADAIAETCVSQ